METPSQIPLNIQKILDDVAKTNKTALAQSAEALQTSTALAEQIQNQSNRMAQMQQDAAKTNTNLANLYNTVSSMERTQAEHSASLQSTNTLIKTILIKLDTIMQTPNFPKEYPLGYPTPPVCAAPTVMERYNPTIPKFYRPERGPPSPPLQDSQQPEILTQEPMEVSDREKR